VVVVGRKERDEDPDGLRGFPHEKSFRRAAGHGGASSWRVTEVSSIGEALVIDAAALWFAVFGSLLFAVTWAGDSGLPVRLRAGREPASGLLRWVDAVILGVLTVGPQVLVLLAALGPYRDFDTPSTVLLLAEPPFGHRMVVVPQ